MKATARTWGTRPRWITDIAATTLLVASLTLILYYFDRPPGPGAQSSGNAPAITPAARASTNVDREQGPITRITARAQTQQQAPPGEARPTQPDRPEGDPQTVLTSNEEKRMKSVSRPGKSSSHHPRTGSSVPPDLGRTATDLYRVVIQ